MPGILIVDDHPAIRTAVRSLLDAHSLAVCGEAADGQAAIKKAKELRPDIILLDVIMPVMNGLEAAQEIRRILPSIKIVFLTLHESARFETTTKLWSHGFVHKPKAATQLVPMLERLLQTMQYPCQQVVMDAFASPRESLPAKISAAERAIAARLTDQNEPDRPERFALKRALRSLRQLLSETQAQAEQHKKRGVA